MSKGKIALGCLILATMIGCGQNKPQEQTQTPPPETQAPAQQLQPQTPQQPAPEASPAPAAPVQRPAAPKAAARPAKRAESAAPTRSQAAQPNDMPIVGENRPSQAAAQNMPEQPDRQPAAPPVPAKPRSVIIPSGTPIAIRLEDALDSGINKAGDTFQATLDQPIEAEGRLVAPRGSVVIGQVVSTDPGGRVQGRAAMALTLTEIHIRDASYKIKTNEFSEQAESSKKSDAAKIGAGAGIGAVIGAIAGGGKGAAIGAAIGGGAGTAGVVASRGKQIKYEVEHPLNFTLRSDLEVPIR